MADLKTPVMIVQERIGQTIQEVVCPSVVQGTFAELLFSNTGLRCHETRSTFNSRFSLIEIGPCRWLLIDNDTPTSDASEVLQDLAKISYVFEQSSAYRVFRCSGPYAEAVLQKGFFLDLNLRNFPIGSCIASHIIQILIFVTRSTEEQFDLLVPRSFAMSFLSWLKEAAAASDVGLELLS